MANFDTIVLGAGGIGSAAAYHLARRGQRVLAIDRFGPAHDRGSSHGETRIIRQAYFEHPDYVPLLLRAYELWRELEQTTGPGSLLQQVGLLQVGPSDGLVVPNVLAAAAQYGLRVDRLTAREAQQRFPGFRVAEGLDAAFEPAAGYLLVERCVLAHLAAAKLAGAEFAFNTAVLGWSAERRGVTVSTDRGEHHAERLVIAAGPWATEHLADLDLGLRVVRKHVYWFTSSSAAMRQDQGCPTFLFELPADGDGSSAAFYGFPQRDALGVKVAEHTGGATVDDPLNDLVTTDSADLLRVQQFLTDCLPSVGPAVVHQNRCFYTRSPDEHFIVDQHPKHPNVVFAAGLSGHGFKFAPVLGESLADLALDGKSNLPISFLRYRNKGETFIDINESYDLD